MCNSPFAHWNHTQDGDHPLLTLCKHLTSGGLFIVGTAVIDSSDVHDGAGDAGKDDVNGVSAGCVVLLSLRSAASLCRCHIHYEIHEWHFFAILYRPIAVEK